MTSVHLLAAIASQPSAEADLLAERRLEPNVVLLAGAAQPEEPGDVVRLVVLRAREIAANMGSPQTLAPHVLLALLGERRCAAHRTLGRLGVDVARLRSSTMNVALGLIGRRRVVGVPAAEARAPAPPNHTPVVAKRGPESPRRSPETPSRRPSGVAIPLISADTARALPRRPGAARIAPSPEPTEPTAPTPAATVGSESPSADHSAAAATQANTTSATSMSATLATPAPTPSMARAGRSARKAAASRFALDPKAFKLLTSLGKNLTLAAERGELEPVIGREAEIERALDVLAKRQANNPLLVGRAGVGKTSVARGIALHIARSRTTGSVDDRVVVEIPITELVANTGVRGALAAKLQELRQEVLAGQGRVVLFFDEIHELFTGEGADEMAGELKLALARGELPCIGATSREGYTRAIDADATIARRFSVVEIDEPDREQAYLVLESATAKLAEHHRVGYAEDALEAAVSWSIRYLPGQALPDKAIAIADLAGARARRRGRAEVEPALIAEVVAELADMPVERLLATDAERMLELEVNLAARVVGHAPQLHRIARILRRNTAGLGGGRPLGSFLLLGPTGVGKTETAKAVAEVLFHSDTALTRIDLSEYAESHALARLVGAPPGYVGHEAGGQLTEAVRRRPYQVILLDEIEKAHPDVLLAFLAVLDEGRLTDGRGRTVDFTNTVLLLTSNLGADASGARPRRRVGFGDDPGPAHQDVERGVIAAARDALAPELYNRLDEVLVFLPLARTEVREIARRTLAKLARTLEERHGATLRADDAAVEALLDLGGYDPTLGARPLRRTIARLVEAPLAELLLRHELGSGATVELTAPAGEVVLTVHGGARGTKG